MKLFLPKRVLSGLFVTLAIIAWLGIYTYISVRKFSESERRIAHSNEILYHASQLSALMMNLEPGLRGYTHTANYCYRVFSEKDSSIVFGHLQRMQTLGAGDTQRYMRVSELEQYIVQRFALTATTVQSRNPEETRSALHEQKALQVIAGIRKSLHAIQQEEGKLLKQRSRSNQQERQRFAYWLAALLGGATLVLVFVLISLYAALKARTKAEASLQRTLQGVRNAYEHAPCGYHTLDDTGVFEDINVTWTKWLKYEKQELVGKLRFQDVITPESVLKFQKHFPLFKTQGFIHNLEIDAVRKDNTVFPVIVNATAIYDEEGAFLRSHATVFDHTDRKHAEEKIHLSNQELEAFTYLVSHDLRAPLRSIDGYTRILLEDHAGGLEEEGRRILGIVVKNAHKMGHLIDDLLNFSRVGRKEIVKTTFNMNGLVQGIWGELVAIEIDRNFEYTMGDLGVAFADSWLMRQVWLNLLSNAVKYTRRAPVAQIEINASVGEHETVYSIRDNGTGFNMEYKHTLFEVFQRLHRAQDFEGTGVGLAIVHRVITRHGGNVWAEGKEGEGAVFYFSLPHH